MITKIKKDKSVKFYPSSLYEEILMDDIIKIIGQGKENKLAEAVTKIINNEILD